MHVIVMSFLWSGNWGIIHALRSGIDPPHTFLEGLLRQLVFVFCFLWSDRVELVAWFH